MDASQLKDLYNKHIRPRVIFAKINALIAFALAFFFLFFGISRCTSGVLDAKDTLTITQIPLNDLGDKADGQNQSSSSVSSTVSESSISSSSEATVNNQATGTKSEDALEKTPEAKRWLMLFDKFARKITVSKAGDTYELQFFIRNYPMNQSGELAFEIYDKDKEHLFTLESDFWNEEGYDDEGRWHETNFSDSLYVEFPYAGDYYITAGVPKTEFGQENTAVFETFTSYSDGVVSFNLLKGSKPYPGVTIFAFFLFIIFGIVILATSSNSINLYSIITGRIDFKTNTYIAQLPGKFPENLFHVTGFTKDPKNPYNWIELILTRNGVNTIVECEKETETDDDGTKTYYYFYQYEELPEETFEKIPNQQSLSFKSRTYKREETEQKQLKTTYYNELTEEKTKFFVNYGTGAEDSYLSFEYAEDASDFDVSLGTKIKRIKVWGIKK